MERRYRLSSNCLYESSLIGGSTVSKILRRREKYMNPQPEDERASQVKKSKAELRDFERTLTIWVKDQKRKGISITDEDLRKQASCFSFSPSNHEEVSSASWLDEFKRKRGIKPPAANEEKTVLPPASPINQSVNYAAVKIQRPKELFDQEDATGSFEQSLDLSEGLEDHDHPAQASLLSPNSAEMTRGQECMTLPEPEYTPGAANWQQRQTFPHVRGFGMDSRLPSSGQNTAALPIRSPLRDSADTGSIPIDPHLIVQQHERVPRYPFRQRPPSPKPDNNIMALHGIKSLLEQNPGVAEPDDYLAIEKLMRKIKSIPPHVAVLPSQTHSIDIMDSPCISKKRSITDIST